MKKFYTISPIFNEKGIGSVFFLNYRIVLEKLLKFHDSNLNYILYINWTNITLVEGFNPIIENGNIVE